MRRRPWCSRCRSSRRSPAQRRGGRAPAPVAAPPASAGPCRSTTSRTASSAPRRAAGPASSRAGAGPPPAARPQEELDVVEGNIRQGLMRLCLGKAAPSRERRQLPIRSHGRHKPQPRRVTLDKVNPVGESGGRKSTVPLWMMGAATEEQVMQVYAVYRELLELNGRHADMRAGCNVVVTDTFRCHQRDQRGVQGSIGLLPSQWEDGLGPGRGVKEVNSHNLRKLYPSREIKVGSTVVVNESFSCEDPASDVPVRFHKGLHGVVQKFNARGHALVSWEGGADDAWIPKTVFPCHWPAACHGNERRLLGGPQRHDTIQIPAEV
ncbi:unnamed protein product [Prorocentrum cordatum]|uniref:Uncharacterized protein n=1 Tax=Prorocentrum cordatum TaxID=2364126 RepID=A0ABN9Q582_9DINO|nr:unnamed protein product [Polarella glacialis]